MPVFEGDGHGLCRFLDRSRGVRCGAVNVPAGYICGVIGLCLLHDQ
jgi:hypothetical protein